ncbi:MAG: hypothetical protein M3R23_07255, partial [Actinomycetota bacterium]|nr:hypothetical protein [Actinomycetota bacterium]
MMTSKPGKRASRRTLILSLFCAGALSVALVVYAVPGQAADVEVCCSANALVNAINNANNKPGADTLSLATGCNYQLSAR